MLPVLAPGKYYGNRQRSRSIPGVTLIENAYPLQFVIPRHSHASAFLGLVLEGGYREIYGNRCRECSPSSLLYHPSGEIHSETHHDVVVRIFTIEPTEQLLTHVRESVQTLDGPQEFRAGPLLRLGAHLYREFRSDDPLAPLAMEVAVPAACAKFVWAVWNPFGSLP
jgi:AraC family transcriptional regulator